MNYIDFFSAMQEFYQRSLSPVSRKYGLTSMELAILLFLANNPRYDTAADIVRKRHLTKSHVSTSVRSLEEKGLIRKEYRDGDHRSVHLILPEEAALIIQDGQAAQRSFYQRLCEGLSKEKKAEMISCFEQMNRNLLRELGEK